MVLSVSCSNCACNASFRLDFATGRQTSITLRLPDRYIEMATVSVEMGNGIEVNIFVVDSMLNLWIFFTLEDVLDLQ